MKKKQRIFKYKYKKFYLKVITLSLIYILFTTITYYKPQTPEDAVNHYFTSTLSKNKLEVISEVVLTYQDNDKAIVDVLGRTSQENYPFARYDVYVKKKHDYWIIEKLIPKDIISFFNPCEKTLG